MSELYAWDTAAAGNNAAPPDGAPETTMTPAQVNNTLREMMAATRRWYDDPEFINLTDAFVVTRPSAFVVRVAGVNLTALFVPSLPVRLTGGPTPQFGFVASSVFSGGNTNITIGLFPLAAIHAATNAIWIHSAQTLRQAAFYEVGTSPGQLPLVEDIPTICARNRAFAPKEDANQSCIVAGPQQITLNGLHYIAVPGATGTLDYQVSVFLAMTRTAVAGTCQFTFQIYLGPTGTPVDAPAFEADVPVVDPSMPTVFSLANLLIPDIDPGHRLCFVLNKVSGPAGTGYVVKGKNLAGTPKADFSYFSVEEVL